VLKPEDGRFTLRSVKLFGDGALGSRGAALLDDYSDQPGWKGFMLKKEDEWQPLIKKWYDEVSYSAFNPPTCYSDFNGRQLHSLPKCLIMMTEATEVQNVANFAGLAGGKP
jgi:hypothetical protein